MSAPVEKVAGITPRMAARLRAAGVATLAELRDMTREGLRAARLTVAEREAIRRLLANVPIAPKDGGVPSWHARMRQTDRTWRAKR